MAGLLDKHLLFVCGKGGTGRSTVAAALGLLAARRGRRALGAAVAGQGHVARALGHEPRAPMEEHELAPGLWTASVDPQGAMEEYLQVQLRLRPLADVLSSSRAFGLFAAATPGMRELLTVGKLWELAQPQRRTRGAARYDLVVVDAPATGHGLAVLRAPRTFADVARVGPIASQGRIIDATLTDPGFTGVVGVARGEEMPVNETLALQDELRRQLGLSLDLCVANAVTARRFADPELELLRRAREHAGSPAARAALRAALREARRAEGEREQLARLQAGLRAPLVELPALGAEAAGRAAHERLADALEPAV